MAKHKDFKSLFGCDDSDEENLQAEFPNSSVIEKTKGVSEITHDDKNKSKHSLKDTHKHTKSTQKDKYDKQKEINSKIERVDTLEGKRLKSIDDEQQKKKIKIQHDSDKSEQKNHVGFDPTESNNINVKSVNNTHSENGDSQKKVKLKKTEIGSLVVKLLTPAYVEKRFESRDIFKTLARNISHALYDKDEQEIKEYIQSFLKKNEEFTSHTTL